MRKKILLVFICAFPLLSKAQIVNIPDANFKNALVKTICTDSNGDRVLDADVDTNDDGEIQVSEALAAEVLFYVPPPPLSPEGLPSLVLPAYDIVDFTGLEAFTNLRKLDVSGNLMTPLDVSMLSQLTRRLIFPNCTPEATLSA